MGAVPPEDSDPEGTSVQQLGEYTRAMAAYQMVNSWASPLMITL